MCSKSPKNIILIFIEPRARSIKLVQSSKTKELFTKVIILKSMKRFGICTKKTIFSQQFVVQLCRYRNWRWRVLSSCLVVALFMLSLNDFPFTNPTRCRRRRREETSLYVYFGSIEMQMNLPIYLHISTTTQEPDRKAVSESEPATKRVPESRWLLFFSVCAIIKSLDFIHKYFTYDESFSAVGSWMGRKSSIAHFSECWMKMWVMMLIKSFHLNTYYDNYLNEELGNLSRSVIVAMIVKVVDFNCELQ